jgi:hypothetical protein
VLYLFYVPAFDRRNFFKGICMTKPNYQKQRNDQIAATNAGLILREIRGFYPTLSLEELAGKIGRSESALLRWGKTGRARKKDLEALLAAFPEPTAGSQDGGVPIPRTVSLAILTELFTRIDGLKAAADSLRTQIGVGGN